MTWKVRGVAMASCIALGTLAAGCAARTNAARPTPFPARAPARPAPPAESTLAGTVLARALALRGTPYRLGGDRPETGFDCSGLVRYAFMEAQVQLPRTVAEQFTTGIAVDEADIQPGDLLFFDIVDPSPSHVGIAIDNGTFLHAPGSGGVVRVERLAMPYWSSRLHGVRRIALGPSEPGAIAGTAQP